MPEDRSFDLWTRLARLSAYTAEIVHYALDPYLPPDVVTSPYYLPGVALLGGLPTSYIIYRALWTRRYRTALHIPLRAFERHHSIKGKVVAVGDSDNFRIYHVPGWFARVPSKDALKGEFMKQTIHIRIAGVDAPESAHFGMPAQPFSAEAKIWLTNYVLDRSVIVKLLSRDRYDRVVAMAYVRHLPFPFPRRNVSLEMLKAGMATVYTAKGAEYGGMLAKFKKAEQKARQNHKGMWSQDMKTYISPGDHKKQHLRGMDV